MSATTNLSPLSSWRHWFDHVLICLSGAVFVLATARAHRFHHLNRPYAPRG